MPLAYDDIVRLAQQGETATVEFKERLTPEVLQGLSTDLASFANAQGGRIIFGITRSGETIGYPLQGKEREQISQRARNCQPPVRIDFEEVRSGSKSFLVVSIPQSKAVHSDHEFRIPSRVGDTTGHLDALAILMLFRERGHVSVEGAEQVIAGGRDQARRIPLPEQDSARYGRLLRAKDPTVQGEAIRDLEKAAYRQIILENPVVVDALGSLMQTGAATEELNRQLMSIARALVLWGSDREKATAVGWLPEVERMAKLSPSAETARAAFDVLGAAHDGRAVQVMIHWVREGDESRFKSLAPEGLLQNIRFYGLYQPISSAMYDILENETREDVRTRAVAILKAARESYGY